MKIFIMAKKMESGGTEVALINLLNELVKIENISITLGLLKKEGIYLNSIPEKVEVIEVLSEKQMQYFELLNLSNKSFKEIIDVFKFKAMSKISLENQYERLLKKTRTIEEEFDIAIDFHGYGYFGTSYVLKKVKAKKKFTFVHDEKIVWIKAVKRYLDNYDKIYCVSNACMQRVLEKYPKYEKKLDTFRNIIDKEKIIRLSKEKIKEMNEKETKLLTVGRLERQKGYDLLIKIAQLLKENDYKFKWYIIGGGSLYETIKDEIEKNNLSNEVYLLGVKKNPYPYFKKADIYIQPSRHEGYGLAIAEARILNKPIIATKLDCVSEQINNKENGLLCEFNADIFYDNIVYLINNENIKNKLIENLKMQNIKEDNDIYKLLEE